MNENNKTHQNRPSYYKSYSSELRKNVNKNDMLNKKINLGDTFGHIFDKTRIVSLERKICTPTADEKNFEIRRMEFSQKKVLEPQMTNEYLQMLIKLLNKKDKDFFKERKKLNKKRGPLKEKNDNTIKPIIIKEQSPPNINKTSSTLFSSNLTRNKTTKTFPSFNNLKTEISDYFKNPSNRLHNNKISKKLEETSTKFVSKFIINPHEKIISKKKISRADNIPYFLLENNANIYSEEDISEDSHSIKTESHGSELSNIDEEGKTKIFKALNNNTEEKVFKEKKKRNIIKCAKGTEDEINRIPFVRNLKLFYNGVRKINQNMNVDKELQNIYVYKNKEKKITSINDDIFIRMKTIDHNRNLKLKEIFSKPNF